MDDKSRYVDPFGKRVEAISLEKQAAAPSYHVIGKAKSSKVNKILGNLKSKKDMLILQEIMSAPKSLRSDHGLL